MIRGPGFAVLRIPPFQSSLPSPLKVYPRHTLTGSQQIEQTKQTQPIENNKNDMCLCALFQHACKVGCMHARMHTYSNAYCHVCMHGCILFLDLSP